MPSKAMVEGSGTATTEYVKDTSSTANPWSLPVSLMSTQRRKISSPAFKDTPVKVALSAVRLAERLPLRVTGVVEAAWIGLIKFKAETLIQVEVLRGSGLVMELLLMR